MITPFGAWPSPVSAELVAGQTLSFGGLCLDRGEPCWSESRPQEGGRHTIMRLRDGVAVEWLPAPFSARTRVHEYGGGAFVVAGGAAYFSNHADGRIYRMGSDTLPQPLTSEGAWRYADLLPDPARARLIAVREDHGDAGEPVNSLVAIDLHGENAPRVLVSGHDFFSSPVLSPDGRRLVWLAWDHPDMPWDGTALWSAELDGNGMLQVSHLIAGGEGVSIFQPQFAPDGTLYFVSDRTGWWNLYRLRDAVIEPVFARSAEFGMPQWVFGMSTYAFTEAHTLVCAGFEQGAWRLWCVDTRTLKARSLEVPDTDISFVRAAGGQAWYVGASPASPPSLIRLEPASGRREVLRRSASVALDAGDLSVPESLTFPTAGGSHAHAFFYAPRNRGHTGPPGERPPLIVVSHGGPTACATSALNLKIQFWTSRGFAVADVNYRGSTGFGRAYREQLNGRWGIADVEDCVYAARHLAARGLVDGERLAIRGSSAGGFTTLSALAFHDVFRAAACLYGISDLEALARDTHKFEARYLDRLIGSYPADRERSPIHHVARMRCPLIFFQGLDDKVVPPDQTLRMAEALRGQGVPVACVIFAGEAHGFRSAGNIVRALEAELYFYGRVFGFTPADPIAPVAIDNLA